MFSISIIIPTKDRPDFLQASVASAMLELPTNAEVLVIDDSESLSAIKALGKNHGIQLRALPNDGTSGPAGARNFGVSQAKNDVIIFLDDDDLLIPGYVANVAQLAKSAQYGFSAIKKFRTPPYQMELFIENSAVDVHSLPFRKQLAGLGCGFWITRRHFLALGGLDETLMVNEDTDFSIRVLAENLKGTYQFEPGVMVRLHGNSTKDKNVGQITKRSSAKARSGYFAYILKKNEDFFNKNPGARNYIRKRRLKMTAKAGLFSEGLAASAFSLPLICYFTINFLIYRLRS
jgi:glycosyltransferase involved in cell wall biosynthesis